jgi:hypothetical protein
MFRGAIGSAKTWPSNISLTSGRATRPATLKSSKVTRLPEAAETVVAAVTSKPRVVRTRARIRGLRGRGVGGGHLCECGWGKGTEFQTGLAGGPDFRT